jgi:hypothetical protein
MTARDRWYEKFLFKTAVILNDVRRSTQNEKANIQTFTRVTMIQAACFATGEYVSLFERRHKDAADLFRNVCFRPANDKSPNRVLIDGTMSYPAGCYNLGKMLMTGKGGVQYNRAEAYQLLDRGCRGGHGGSCYLQAQILCARPGTLGPNIPHDPFKAMELYENNCKELGDSIRYDFPFLD